jgi:protein-tyrosine phosphatase
MAINVEFDHILVLCTGNICRSPMAEGLLRQYFPDRKVSSAGLQAMVDYPADEHAISLMQDMEIDIAAHRAQQVSTALLKQADLIFVMTKGQLKLLEKQWPFVRGKAFLLGHWQNQEIPDPYQQPRSAFLYARELTITGIKAWHEKLAP